MIATWAWRRLAHEPVPGDQGVADVEEAGADDRRRRCPTPMALATMAEITNM